MDQRKLYLEDQGLAVLKELTDPRPALSADLFRMRRQGERSGSGGRESQAVDPWTKFSRAELMAELTKDAGQTAFRLVCVTHDAGQGKTKLLHWLQKEIHAQSERQLAIRMDVAKACVAEDAFMAEMLGTLGLQKAAEGQDVLTRMIEAGRVVFLLDGLDQAASTVRTDLLWDFMKGMGDQCRFVLAGRPSALHEHWSRVFRPQDDACPWRFVLLEYFTEEQQEKYLGREIWGKIPEDAREVLAVPRAASYLLDLQASNSALLSRIHKAGELYYHVANKLVCDGLRAMGTKGKLNRDQVFELLSAIAFQMVKEGNFDRVTDGQMAGFKSRVALRCGLPPESFAEQWLRPLAVMNEMVDCGFLEGDSVREILWRNRSLQEFFAALWLARGFQPKNEEDGVFLRGSLPVGLKPSSEPYYWLWRYTAELPEEAVDPRVWPLAMRVAYMPDAYQVTEPHKSGRKRATEIIWRSWETMERLPEGRKVIAEFLGEFQELLKEDGDRAKGWTEAKHGVAKEMMANFVQCPAGRFQMGSPGADEERYGDETLYEAAVEAFLLAKCAVTNEQYALFEPAHRSSSAVPGAEAGYPVTEVSWWDSWVFSRWARFRLPTEAEWEYACRAGSRTRYCFGDEEAGLGDYAWYRENSGNRAHPVGTKKANRWGLHDMHGNVWEWCQDWFGAYPQVSPPGYSGPELGSYRVDRGGSWWNGARHCRSARRDGSRPGYRGDNLGFRLALSAVR